MKIVFAPLAEVVFSSLIKLLVGLFPKEFIPGVEKGINQAKDLAPLQGFPLSTFEAVLVDGASHDVTHQSSLFEIAGRAAFQGCYEQSGSKVVGTSHEGRVITPEEYMGDIIGDLNSRRGNVGGMEPRGNAKVIDAMVPLANMFGHINNFTLYEQGRAQYSMQFDHYEQVPQAVADEVRAKMA